MYWDMMGERVKTNDEVTYPQKELSLVAKTQARVELLRKDVELIITK